MEEIFLDEEKALTDVLKDEKQLQDSMLRSKQACQKIKLARR